MEADLIFIGHKHFKKKGSDDEFYVVNFVTYPQKNNENGNVSSSFVTVFTEKDKYEKYISSNKLLSTVKVPFEVNGSQIRYYI